MKTNLQIVMSNEDVMGLLLDLRQLQDIYKDRAKPEYVNHAKWAQRWEEVEIRKMRLVNEAAKNKVVS